MKPKAETARAMPASACRSGLLLSSASLGSPARDPLADSQEKTSGAVDEQARGRAGGAADKTSGGASADNTSGGRPSPPPGTPRNPDWDYAAARALRHKRTDGSKLPLRLAVALAEVALRCEAETFDALAKELKLSRRLPKETREGIERRRVEGR
jgi:hypothetical protein